MMAKWDAKEPDWRATVVAPDPIGYDEIQSAEEEDWTARWLRELADIAPVAYSHDQTRHITALRALDLSGLTSRAEADGRLAAAVTDPALRAFFLQSLDLKATPPRWRINLDVLEAEMSKIIGWPQVAGRFDGPTLFLSGALSRYVLPDHREAIRTLFPAARFAKLPGAGHWLHAEKPREFEETVRVFLG
jgi:pimeloyl-ACP methyl ester carboxylesterase